MQGRRVIFHRNAIVVHEDSSSLVYKHFELSERRVVKARLSRGSLPYSVTRSSPAERRAIVDTWKQFGFTLTVTDQGSKTTRVFCGFLDFYPPGGRGSLMESIPPRTSLPLLLDRGGADEIDFSKIDRLEFQGERLKVTLRDGRVEEGKFLMPTDSPAEARLLGITDRYDPASSEVFDFSLPLAHVKEIRFDHK